MTKLLVIFILFSNILFSQTISDALLISQGYVHGSARYQSMGGAFTSLGGELSSMNLNPASGAVFFSSEASVSYSNSMVNNDVSFYNKGGEANKTYNNVNQLGVIFIIEEPENNSSIVKYGIGVNYSRLNNFNEQINFAANNDTQIEVYSGKDLMYRGYSSFVASLLLEADGYIPDDLGPVEGMAYDNFLIDINDVKSPFYDSKYLDYSDDFPLYVSSAIAKNSFQNYTLDRSGRSGEYTFSFSMDVNEKLYIGASYNRTNIDMMTSISLSESEFSESSYVDKFTYRSFVNTSGNGSSVSLGAILKANKYIRLGLSYHSSTKYNLMDLYSYSLSVKYKKPPSDESASLTYSEKLEDEYFTYTIYTPRKLNTGISAIFGTLGLISLDYEYLNYSSMSFEPESDFEEENKNIKQQLKNTSNNIRLGTEWNVSYVSLRGGYTYRQSPYRDEKIKSSIQSLSLGIGFNFNDWNFDVSYQQFMNTQDYYIYEVDLVDAANIDRTEQNIVATLRFSL